MKKIYSILVAVLITASAFSQAPQRMSYQGVIRNAGNNLVTNTAVGMRVSILQGSPVGTSVYVETQVPTTNVNGLVSIEVGNGAVVSGTFSAINWANGPYFIKTDTDPTGGTSYSITGTSQLLSVPYALYAGNATTYSAGAGISIAGGTITNTAPNQSVAITATGNTTVTGAYPNYTLNTLTYTSGAGIAIVGNTISLNYTPGINNFSVYSAPGTYTYTVPTGVPKIMVEVWGGGGGGGNGVVLSYNGSSGAGGGYGKEILTVIPLSTYTLTVGNGGVAQTNGSASIFAGSITSTGGAGSPGLAVPIGGTSTASFNVSGENGWWGLNGGTAHGGGAFGTNGGRSGINGANAGNGTAPGGGGGGGANVAGFTSGGTGGSGRIVISW